MQRWTRHMAQTYWVVTLPSGRRLQRTQSHRAGVMEVVADSLRAAELIDRAIFAPALHGGELVGINVVIQQQDELLVTPGTEGHIASLHLQVGAARDGKELCGRQYSC